MIALGSDHAGLPLKKEIMALLDEMQLLPASWKRRGQ